MGARGHGNQGFNHERVESRYNQEGITKEDQGISGGEERRRGGGGGEAKRRRRRIGESRD